jgi:hypothetical protein
MRKSIKLKLKDFAFESDVAAVEFLRHHPDVLKLLPKLGVSLKTHFGADARLTLELLDEGPAWQTLFINVYTRCDWANARQFMDVFLRKIFKSPSRCCREIKR